MAERREKSEKKFIVSIRTFGFVLRPTKKNDVAECTRRSELALRLICDETRKRGVRAFRSPRWVSWDEQRRRRIKKTIWPFKRLIF